VGAPVFIAVRCIAATRAAGTAYEPINQSINQFYSTSSFLVLIIYLHQYFDSTNGLMVLMVSSYQQIIYTSNLIVLIIPWY
jgi:hypothetical protein